MFKSKHFSYKEIKRRRFNMQSVRAIYDGETIQFLDKIEIKKPQKVIVTFLDEEVQVDLNKVIYKLVDVGKSFDFLKEPKEDIYTDKDLKIKHKKWKGE